MRRQSNPKYKIPAIYIKDNKETFFRCYIDRKQVITDAMGNSFKIADGELLIETDADIHFELNYDVKIMNDDVLTINNVLSRIPNSNDNNALRGAPTYITRFIIN